MNVRFVAQLALGVAATSILMWFYPHCARPALAYAGSRPLGFWLALFGTAVASIALLATPVLRFLDFHDIADAGLTATWLAALPLLAYLQPRWLVRLTGGPDGSVPPRYVLTWYWEWWRKDDFGARRAIDLIHWLPNALRELPVTADQEAIEQWVRELEHLKQLGDEGDFDTLNRDMAAFYEKLARVRPVEPLGAIL